MAILVLLVERHLLAARYLYKIVHRVGFIVRENCDLLTHQSHLANRALVLVIDGDTISKPVAPYLRSLRAKFPHGKILVLSKDLTMSEQCRLLALGIHGFVPHHEIESSLRHAIRSVWQGHLWVSTEVLEEFAKYVSKLSQLRDKRSTAFTSREQLTLRLLERELSNKEISSALGIRERTVKFHLQNIFAKTGVHDRRSVVEFVKSQPNDLNTMH